MDKSAKILSDIVVFNKYAKYDSNLGRRETFKEIIFRYTKMMVDRYPELEDSINTYAEFIHERKILPSMRAMQFAGAAVEKNEARIYNCCSLPIDHYKAFSEIMFLLLGGSGVGYSVQLRDVSKLPSICKPKQEQKYIVGDSIEGWADAVRHLMSSYLGVRRVKPRFDFSDIRVKGSRLVTAGGKAPGPEPLKTCLFKIETLLERKQEGEQLTSLEVHDIVCHIADAVLAGGIRRAALICLFSPEDEAMITCKTGAWWELNPQRGRANNSAVLLRDRVTREQFIKIWDYIKNSGSGEPGVYFSNNADWGTNPCCEIALKPYQFCNLSEVNVSDLADQADLNDRVFAASFFGTLQAGFTDFHYLRPIWKTTTEEDALVGVGMTGIASGVVLELNLKEAAQQAKLANEATSKIIGINRAARITTIKPSGTTSCVLGTSSGIHAWHAPYYIRRMQVTKDEDIYEYVRAHNPLLVADYTQIANSAVVELPQRAPENAIVREEETALSLLERVSKFNREWVKSGHRSGDNTNNVSATIPIKDGEWDEVGEWMWNNRDDFNGLSVLPFDGGTYEQAPFEQITEEKYDEMITYLNGTDLSKLFESKDNTNRQGELACSGGACEV